MIIQPLSQCPEFIRTVSMWAFSYWYANSGIRLSVVQADYHRRADFSSLPVTWVAIDAGCPVGMVSLKETDLSSHRHLSPWLSALYVIPEYRKKGIAMKLIDTVTLYAAERGFETLNLFTDNRQGAYLYKYYTARGWSLLEKAYDHNGTLTNIMNIQLKVPVSVSPDRCFVPDETYLVK